MLVKVEAHAGVVDGVHPHIQQLLHMTMEQLGRETHRVAGDAGLPFEEGRPAGLGRHDRLKAQLGEKACQKGAISHMFSPRGMPMRFSRIPGTGARRFMYSCLKR